MKGKLIVIEGSDGSGKSTQLELLKKYFEQNTVKFKSIKFPRYTDGFFGKTIASFLKGSLGKLQEINPYVISIVYAMDRSEAKELLNKWLQDGNIVVMDRYATSNMAHQYGRIEKNKREHFLKWVEELEYSVNKIPREDLVLFLHVPYQISKKLLNNKDQDIVEKDSSYLKNSEQTYLKLAKKFPHWVTVECVKNSTMRSKTDIHNEIVGILKKKNIV